jgi:hypothetical protein
MEIRDDGERGRWQKGIKKIWGVDIELKNHTWNACGFTVAALR